MKKNLIVNEFKAEKLRSSAFAVRGGQVRSTDLKGKTDQDKTEGKILAENKRTTNREKSLRQILSLTETEKRGEK